MENYFRKITSAAPLAVFRIALGLLLFGSIIRFWINGWIHELYIAPKHFFSYFGFGFVEPFGEFTYVLFAVCAISALFFAAGFYYRPAAITLFLSFTYIELIDKSTYLNHYYFVSMICLMMIFLPAHATVSFDAHRKGKHHATVPLWCVDAVKLFVCLVYFCAGLAKLNSDWLVEALPLRIWLPAKNDLPLIGFIFNYSWVAFAFSWLGCLYDLSIPFLLMSKTTRNYAYVAVIIFHTLTALLFPIGMFPYIMIATGLIFLSPTRHENILSRLAKRVRLSYQPQPYDSHASSARSAFLGVGFALFFFIQITMPFRYLLYPGELFWTEQGYRFSWRVMLMEKAGSARFIIVDESGKKAEADNREFLTPLQEKMMATQPDMMLQYAHILRDHYTAKGFLSPKVYVDSYVTLNGRLGKPLIDPHTDLASEEESFAHKPWILPFENEIEGL